MDNLFVFDLDGTIIMDNEKINPLICQAFFFYFSIINLFLYNTIFNNAVLGKPT